MVEPRARSRGIPSPGGTHAALPPSLRAATVGVALALLALTGCASGAAAPSASGGADEGYVTPGKLTDRDR